MSQSKRALISVSDKTGIEKIASALAAVQIEILSTGGTAATLREAGLTVTDVSEVTGFPEIMDGRVKTLHPKIHGGLLGRRGQDDAIMSEHGIGAIDLLIVNLYPFEKTVAQSGCSREDAIENIDIGGPAMIRAAAKNHRDVAVVVDPADYDRVIDELNVSGELSTDTREDLARKAFGHTAAYDAAIWNYLDRDQDPRPFGETFPLPLRKHSELRYGENPHQRGALYSLPEAGADSLVGARQHQGKPLSYNNLADADAALECVKALAANACVIVKHANPCGVGIDADLTAAYEKAYATDPTSAFGGIIAFNAAVDATLAETIIDRQFLEVIVAPGIFTGGAGGLLAETEYSCPRNGPADAGQRNRDCASSRSRAVSWSRTRTSVTLAPGDDDQGRHRAASRTIEETRRRDRCRGPSPGSSNPMRSSIAAAMRRSGSAPAR